MSVPEESETDGQKKMGHVHRNQHRGKDTPLHGGIGSSLIGCTWAMKKIIQKQHEVHSRRETDAHGAARLTVRRD